MLLCMTQQIIIVVIRCANRENDNNNTLMTQIQAACRLCGLTIKQIVRHWEISCKSNPNACANIWYGAGYRFSVPSDMLQTKDIDGCLVNDVFNISGDPYRFYDASTDHARARAANELPPPPLKT